MLRGTFCRLSVRFCAVTMTSSRVPEFWVSACATDRQAKIAEASGNALARGDCDPWLSLRTPLGRRSFLNLLRVMVHPQNFIVSNQSGGQCTPVHVSGHAWVLIQHRS